MHACRAKKTAKQRLGIISPSDLSWIHVDDGSVDRKGGSGDDDDCTLTQMRRVGW